MKIKKENTAELLKGSRFAHRLWNEWNEHMSSHRRRLLRDVGEMRVCLMRILSESEGIRNRFDDNAGPGE